MKVLSRVAYLFDRIIDILAVIAAVLLGVLVVLICSEVFSRMFFRHSILAVIEISEYSLLYITFLGTTWVLRKDKHTRMDIALVLLNSKTQIIVNIVTSLVSALICLILTWYGGKVVWKFFQMDYQLIKTLSLPFHLIIGIIPIGGFLLFVQYLRRAYGYLMNWRSSSA